LIGANRAILVVGAAMALGVTARAQERQPTAADVFFRRGRDLLRQGKDREACEQFLQSQRLEPAAGTLLNLAVCTERLGDLVGALDHLEKAIVLLPPEDTRFPVAKERHAALERRIPHVTLHPEAGAPENMRVKVDGVDGASLGTPMRLNPGEHVIIVMADRFSDGHALIRIEEGEFKHVPVGPGPALPPPHVLDGAQPRLWGRWLPWVIGGVGLAAAGTGAALYAGASSDYDDLERTCGRTVLGCPPSRTDGPATQATVSYVLLGTGAAALATGAVLWWWSGRSSDARRAWLLPTPGGAVAIGAF
jgi:hypothetical protein